MNQNAAVLYKTKKIEKRRYYRSIVKHKSDHK